MIPTIQQTYSRKRASLGMVAFNQLHYTNPWVVAAWSFFFPGYGHIMLGEYIQGWILFLWEVYVNTHARFNTAIMLAFTGRFHESVHVLRQHGNYWILLYGTVFCYALFGCYHLAVESNNIYGLAFEENIPIEIFKINAFQFNLLNKRVPYVAALWSLLMPGLGDMYVRRITSAIFGLGWWITIVEFSNVLPAVVYTFTGHFEHAGAVVNPEWVLYLPSIYAFTFYNSYSSVSEQGKLFDKQQATYLKAMYQSPIFPFRLKEENQLRIVSTFDHSLYLEKALVSIKKQGISKDQIFAVPMDKNDEGSSISLDTMHHSDGKSFFDVPSLVAGLCCALGTIYGFVLHWGPVLWGLIGFAGGLILGCVIKIISIKLSSQKAKKRSQTEVVLMIDCDKELASEIKQILWNNQAFGVAEVGVN